MAVRKLEPLIRGDKNARKTVHLNPSIVRYDASIMPVLGLQRDVRYETERVVKIGAEMG